jgi:hypothetical protein
MVNWRVETVRVDISSRPKTTRFSADHCENIRKGLTGRSLTPEHREHIGAALRQVAARKARKEQDKQ